MLTAADVTAKRFTPTKFREGYDQAEVDAFLDRVVATLDGTAGAAALTAELVAGARFDPTTFREGYDQDEVDDFLDEVALTLGGASAGAGPVGAGAVGPTAGDGVPGASTGGRSAWRHPELWLVVLAVAAGIAYLLLG